jgi:cold shock protein
MERGHVKWYNDEKRFGFVTLLTGADCFIHGKILDQCKINTLYDNQVVDVDTSSGSKGRFVTRIVVDE